MQISDVLYLEKVFKTVRQNLNRPEDDQMLDQNVSVFFDLGIVSVNNDESISSSLGQITIRIWLRTGTPFLRSSSRCSILHRDLSWNRI